MSSMCGIIDFEKSGVDFSTLREMGRAMILRVQDQSGAYLNGVIGLYHNRCIIGEPERAREPYTGSRNGKNYTVCFDGELKNCRGQNGDFDLLDFESAAQAVAELRAGEFSSVYNTADGAGISELLKRIPADMKEFAAKKEQYELMCRSYKEQLARQAFEEELSAQCQLLPEYRQR